MLLRGLYESWLLRSTGEPLAPWQRSLLLKALQKDAALRELAADLAVFSHESGAPAEDQAPDLRVRLVHLALDSELQALPEAPRGQWVLAGLALALLAGLIGMDWLVPAHESSEVARVEQPAEALALALPSATPSPAPTAAVTASTTSPLAASASAQALPSKTAPPR